MAMPGWRRRERMPLSSDEEAQSSTDQEENGRRYSGRRWRGAVMMLPSVWRPLAVFVPLELNLTGTRAFAFSDFDVTPTGLIGVGALPSLGKKGGSSENHGSYQEDTTEFGQKAPCFVVGRFHVSPHVLEQLL
jgi:hypothetical protein